MSSQHSTTEKLRLLIRDKSATGLVAMSNSKNVQTLEIQDDRKILGHWMAIISISGEKVHLTFKIQFAIKDARNFAKSNLNNKEISNSHSKDFIRELCNVIAGYLKHTLSENNIQVGISLPLLARGFDDLFFNSTGKTNLTSDRWKLSNNDDALYCSSVIEMTGDVKLDDNFKDVTTTSGDVEFL